ncbi:hypothetical protein [Frondihabitans cladoniiphilus]|uniref:Uncharacterized protein n=1 Tax=Frondihabitans cladoniiphilus TaxID=715785 RepID=A0ABP8WDR9_9MICO
MSAAEKWVPEFEGQRPPFEAGNMLALKSGWRSPRLVGPIAEELIAAILEDPHTDYLREARFRPAVIAWAQVEARVALYERYMEGMSMEQRLESSQGRTSPEEQLRRLDANALTHRGRLGLDPLSAARLGKDIAATRVDLASLLADERDADGGAPRGA